MLFKKFRFGLRDYLTLTTRERRGMMWLLLILAIQLSWLFYSKFISVPEPVDLAALGIKIGELQAPEPASNSWLKRDTVSSNDQHSDSLYSFDPNTISTEELQMLGFSEKQAKSVVKFRQSGARFKQKSDFAKCYAVSASMFKRLEPYTLITETPFSEKVAEKNRKRLEEASIFELNTATALQLEELPGIGIKTAERIVRYRDALGGFVNISQLKEVYGLDSLDIRTIEHRLQVNVTLIRYINLNDDSLRHPYLPWKVTRLIREYRRQHGDFKNHSDILNVALLNGDIYRKIAPYLKPE